MTLNPEALQRPIRFIDGRRIQFARRYLLSGREGILPALSSLQRNQFLRLRLSDYSVMATVTLAPARQNPARLIIGN